MRQARKSLLTSSALVWEAIDTKGRQYAVEIKQSSGSWSNVGKEGQRGRCSSWMPGPSSMAMPCTPSTSPAVPYMMPIIARTHSTSPQSDHSSAASCPSTDQGTADHAGTGQSESVEMDEERMKSVLLDKALSYVVRS